MVYSWMELVCIYSIITFLSPSVFPPGGQESCTLVAIKTYQPILHVFQGRVSVDRSLQKYTIRWPCPTPKKHLICFVVMSTSGKTHPFPVDFGFVHRCFRKCLVQFSTKLTCENQEWHSTERLCTAAVSQRRWCKVLLYQATIKQQSSNNVHLDGSENGGIYPKNNNLNREREDEPLDLVVAHMFRQIHLRTEYPQQCVLAASFDCDMGFEKMMQ